MKFSIFKLLIIFFLVNSYLFSQVPQVEINTQTNNDKEILTITVDDAPTDNFVIGTATSFPNQFLPTITGHYESGSAFSLGLQATTTRARDIFNEFPMMLFTSRIGEFGLGQQQNQEPVMNKLLFGWSNFIDMKMVLSASGNLGIGTINPFSKIHISDGDIYIADINNGVIMKSQDGQCWRYTPLNTGQLTSTSITCPN